MSIAVRVERFRLTAITICKSILATFLAKSKFNPDGSSGGSF
jgi:hypothetical protein